jgi:hypothetical protein
MFTFKLHHPRKVLAFGLLSLADLYLTWRLLQAEHGRVYESNPVASAWLESYGWFGLATFKALAMLMVVALAIIISRHRPRTASGILWFACTATAAVVIYSCILAGMFGVGPGRLQADEVQRAEEHGLWLDHKISKEREYMILMSQLAKDLIGQRCTLVEAVDRLVVCDKAQNQRWLGMLHQRYPDYSDKECLAIHLGYHTLVRLSENPARMERLARRLESDFRTGFGNVVQFELGKLEEESKTRKPQLSAIPHYMPLLGAAWR